MVTTIAARYDRSAARYERWWAPVLAPSARRMLETLEARLDGPPRRVLDVGTGTGTLVRAVVERWPEARVIGVDASGAMLGVARGEIARTLPASAVDRIDWRVGSASALPLPDAGVDLAISSFVLQLVPDRRRALEEMRRVLAPGAWLGYVTWLADDTPFEPETVFEDLIDEEALDEGSETEEPRSGNPASAPAAARQARRAGFRSVRAQVDELQHVWTARSYLPFLERYDAAELFESLDPSTRRRVRARLAERFGALPRSSFRWRTPVVTVTGRRPVR